jgi:hypothetical protein
MKHSDHVGVTRLGHPKEFELAFGFQPGHQKEFEI